MNQERYAVISTNRNSRRTVSIHRLERIGPENYEVIRTYENVTISSMFRLDDLQYHNDKVRVKVNSYPEVYMFFNTIR